MEQPNKWIPENILKTKRAFISHPYKYQPLQNKKKLVKSNISFASFITAGTYHWVRNSEENLLHKRGFLIYTLIEVAKFVQEPMR